MFRTASPPQTLRGRRFAGTRDLPTLTAIYYLGDFRYQILSRDGWRSKVRLCQRYDTLEWLYMQLYSGNTLVVEAPTVPVYAT